MHPLEKETHLLLHQKNLLTAGDRLVVAVSGGPDSMALLHVLARLAAVNRFSLVAAYIDHGLRPAAAAREITLVREQAARLGLVFKSGAVPVQAHARQHKMSIEQAGRLLRYAELEKIARECDAPKIALGHTADDQVEETLLRLIRGTGRKGLSGMKFQRDKFIRPFLKIPKSRLLEYLARYDIPFLEDDSNRQRIFLRNRIRLDLIPYLTEHFNPGIKQTVLQLADVLQEEEALLAELTAAACDRIFIGTAAPAEKRRGRGEVMPGLELDLSLFAKETPAIQRRLLENACWRMQNQPAYRQIEQLRQISAAAGRAVLHLAGGLRVSRQGDRLVFAYPAGKTARRGNLAESGPDRFEIRIDRPGLYDLGQLAARVKIDYPVKPPADLRKAAGATDYLDASRISFPLTIRSPEKGDRFQPLGSRGRKKVSDFLIDQKIPRAQRWQVPVLLSAGKILGLPGLRIDHAYRITASTAEVLSLTWLKTQP